ncbi:MAG: ATP-binding protein [Symploca sp. SIO2B6]|nr:ATP-binding protein [Symploca sp. SIO2B6]
MLYLPETPFTIILKTRKFSQNLGHSCTKLLVISPAYMADGFNQFVDLLAQCYGLETATWLVIPLVLKPVKLPPRLNSLVKLNATNPDEWEEATLRLCGDLQRSIPDHLSKPPCPYPGMEPFTETDSDRFFGRDQEVEELIERLRLHPFISVVGPSGSGKSSLVLAGLIPALRRSRRFGCDEWLVYTMRPGETPLKTLKTTLGIEQANSASLEIQTLVKPSPVQHLLLVVDQFEEV